jgi:orotidine-5'-phosphate decarboxylase
LTNASTARQDALGRLIVALDVPTASAALALTARLRGHVGLVKVGLELFSAEGPSLVRTLVDEQARVFLDLKVHDIPNTARGAARAVARLGVSMMTVHASGGTKMMQAAAEGAREGAAGAQPLLLGVTALTSLGSDNLAEIGWGGSPSEVVLRLAALAQSAGLGGVVASPQEAAPIRERFGPDFAIVTPGIRPQAASLDDQARAAAPGAAIAAGADFLVIGRPITQASDPVAAADAVVAEMAIAWESRGLEVTRERN